MRIATAFLVLIVVVLAADNVRSDCVDTCSGTNCFQYMGDQVVTYLVLSGVCYREMRRDVTTNTSCYNPNSLSLRVRPSVTIPSCTSGGSSYYRYAPSCSWPTGSEEPLYCCTTCGELE
jgi:hypothetical protein